MSGFGYPYGMHTNRVRPATIIRAIITAVTILVAVAGVTMFERAHMKELLEHDNLSQQLYTDVLLAEESLHDYDLDRSTLMYTEYADSRQRIQRTLKLIHHATVGSSTISRRLRTLVAAERRWQVTADRSAQVMESNPTRPMPKDLAHERHQFILDVARADSRARRQIANETDSLLKLTLLWALLPIVGLGIFFSAQWTYVVRRSRRVEAARRAVEQQHDGRQLELRELLQVAHTEHEAQKLLARHLSRAVDGADVVLLNRNNSENRLNAVTPLAEGSPLHDTLELAEPRSCLSIRLNRPVTHDSDAPPLVACTLCGTIEGRSSCRPMQVGGAVIGSVLVSRQHAITGEEDETIADSVAMAAPTLGNLRNLAIAEARASTDVLTGLPNRRSMNDSLKRLIAHSRRSELPVTMIMFDLDHFKKINDDLGHEAGDTVLAAVGQALRSVVRGSDVVARTGGEEFVVLLPDTSCKGGVIVAEKLREIIMNLHIPSVMRRVSASFGVADLPEHAADEVGLARAADRALYVAKSNGRNRVEVADQSISDMPDDQARDDNVIQMPGS